MENMNCRSLIRKKDRLHHGVWSSVLSVATYRVIFKHPSSIAV